MPFVVRWLGRVPAGATSDAPIVHTDMARTLAVLVGRELPGEAGEDRVDQRAALLCDAASARDPLVHRSGAGLFAIRSGRWKLIPGRGSGGFSPWTPPEGAPASQLYDLRRDPAGQHDVFAVHPEVVAELQARPAEIRASSRSAPAAGG